MKRIAILLSSLLLLLTGCGGNDANGYYEQITQEAAKEMMDTEEVIILDVREQDEYDSGHIPGAVMLPVGTIDEETAAEVIPEKDSTVLSTAAVETEARQLLPHWPNWATPTSMNSAVSIPGPMRRNRKASSTKFISPHLKLVGTESCNGVVDLMYERR